MYQHILLAVDGSPSSELALREATRVASSGAIVRAVTVVENPLITFPAVYGVAENLEMVATAMLNSGRKILAAAEIELRRQVQPGVLVETVLLDLSQLGGMIPGTLQHHAESWPADLIVIGSHGRSGIKRLFLGSVAEHLLRLSTTPILLVRESQTT
ncbi:MAG: universal stress protein [Herbaspirillum sp.]